MQQVLRRLTGYRRLDRPCTLTGTIDSIGDTSFVFNVDIPRKGFHWIKVEKIPGTRDELLTRTDSQSIEIFVIKATSDQIAGHMRAARNIEYQALLDDAAASTINGTRAIQRLRRTLRKIERRDNFKAPLRDRARLAIDDLAAAPIDDTASAS